MNAATDPRPSARPGGGPLEVAPGCWMVGHRNPAALLQCNTYLRTFDGPTPRRVCVDPGSQFDFSVIESNIGQLIGDLSEVDAFTINHQDPDVVGNSQYFCDANPKIEVTISEDAWRLVRHLLIKPGALQFANPARTRLPLGGNAHPWQVVPTPFCHFRGAVAFYDPEIRTLFSGDLFGGVNQLGRVHLFAEEPDWAGVAQFHQIYMPTREVLRYAVRQIRALDPPVEIIAPQHGHVIAGDLVPLFLERLGELLVGHDLLSVELDVNYLAGYREVLARLLQRAETMMDPKEVRTLLKSSSVDDHLQQQLRFTGDEVHLDSGGYSALVKVFNRLTLGEPLEFANTLRGTVLTSCTEQGVPVPPIGVGVEEGAGPSEPEGGPASPK